MIPFPHQVLGAPRISDVVARGAMRPSRPSLAATAAFKGFIGIVLLAWSALSPLTADDAAVATGINLEPTEFVDTAPAQADPTTSNPASASSGSWGFVVFSPDSKLAATVAQPEGDGAKGEIVVWDVAEAKMRCQYWQPSRIPAAVFSPDGNLLAVGPGGPQFGVVLIDTSTGEIQQKLPGPAARTNCVAWSTDGKRLALGSSPDKSVREWDVTLKKFVKAHEIELPHLLAVAYTREGQLLVAASPARERMQLQVLDAASGKSKQTLTGHKETIEAAEFSADASRIVTAAWDASVRVWELAKGESIAELKGHKRGINTVSQSADGKRIASANTREFKLWDGEKKEQLADLGGESNGARQVAMSPDGAWLISIMRDGSAQLWDVEKKAQKTTLDRAVKPVVAATPDGEKPAAPPITDAPEPEAIQALAYSRDGKWLAIAREDGRICIRTAIDGKLHRELEAFGDVASSVAFSPDSSLLASGSFEKVVKIWKADSGELVAELAGHGNWVFSVAFSPDGQTLASASYDKTVRIWDIAKHQELAALTGHTAGVRAVTFTRDGKHLISGGSDRTAIVWNVASRELVATLKGHSAAIRDIACSPDGETVATASEDATIKLWRTKDWTERGVAKGADGVMFWSLAYSPQGRTLAGGAFDGTVKLFDPDDGKERKTLRGPTDAITSVAFAPDSHEIIAGSIDKSYRRWKAQSGGASTTPTTTVSTGETRAPELKPAEAAIALNAVTLKVEQQIASLGFDKSGKLLAVGVGGYKIAGGLQLWDVVKREKKWQAADSKFGGISAAVFSPNDQQLAVGNFADNFLRLYNVADGEKIKELRGHRSKVHDVAYSPNGKYFATASLDRDTKLWDAATNREIRTFIGHKDYVFSIEFSPDGKLLLSGSADQTAKLWNVESGKEARQLGGHVGMIQLATFSRDGTRVATASADGTSRVYETATGDYLFTLRGHRNRLESVAFSADGALIATGSTDRTIRLWDASCGAELLKINQEATVRVVLFAPDGKHLVSGSDDKTVKFWEVSGIAVGTK